MVESTIIALATPIGKGAIAIIRLSGKNVLEIIKHFIKLENIESHKLYHTKIENIDDVMFVYMQAPKTYTGEDIVEINCHNNIFIINQIIALACKFGAKLAKPGEFTERAFLNGKLDLSQAEAVLDVISAESRYAENIAQKQLNGGLKTQVEFFRNEILDLLKDLEVILDHEDILEFDKQTFLQKLQQTQTELLHKIEVGQRVDKFCSGLNIAIIGRPNVGKSSILNRILEKEKSIVSDIAGTTRDAIEAVIEHKGIKINLIDTAGLKHNDEFKNDLHTEIEKKGIQKTKEFIDQADYVFFVVDLTKFELLKDVHNLQNVIVVGNKLDKQRIELDQYIRNLPFKSLNNISISAKTGENIDKLLDLCIEDFLKNREISDSKFVLNIRHKQVFYKVLASMDNAKNLLETDEGLELISIELRRAVDLLAEILGIDVSEEILDRIFSNFCIGK